MSLYDLQRPRVEIFFHDARRSSRSLAAGIQIARFRITVGYRAGGDPDQLRACLFQLRDDLREICLISLFIILRVPMSMVETDHVPMPTFLPIASQPLDDPVFAFAAGSAVGGRMMQIELAGQRGAQAFVVVAGDRVTDEEITRKLRVVDRGLVADGDEPRGLYAEAGAAAAGASPCP